MIDLATNQISTVVFREKLNGNLAVAGLGGGLAGLLAGAFLGASQANAASEGTSAAVGGELGAVLGMIAGTGACHHYSWREITLVVRKSPIINDK